jgi:hypothetical protein
MKNIIFTIKYQEQMGRGGYNLMYFLNVQVETNLISCIMLN